MYIFLIYLGGKGKRNSLSLPSYRDLIYSHVATIGRSRGRPVIREIIPNLGEMRGVILTYDFEGQPGNSGQKPIERPENRLKNR